MKSFLVMPRKFKTLLVEEVDFRILTPLGLEYAPASRFPGGWRGVLNFAQLKGKELCPN
jgi:hypothetical protein